MPPGMMRPSRMGFLFVELICSSGGPPIYGLFTARRGGNLPTLPVRDGPHRQSTSIIQLRIGFSSARAALPVRNMASASTEAPLTVPVPVWLWYEYSSAPARYIQLNIQALRRHAPASHFDIRLVNRSNIGLQVPDLPLAFWNLPTHVAFSDAGRLALLAHKGGIYLDADFLVTQSLMPVHNMLKTADLVGYPKSPVHGVSQSAEECEKSGEISANFIAARPNTTLFRNAWHLFRTALQRMCRSSIKRKIYICCLDKAGQLLPKCRVPHALTDLMLTRARLLEWPPRSMQGRRNATLRCLSGHQDLTPPRLVPMTTDGRTERTLSKVLSVSSPVLLKNAFGKWRLLARSLGCEHIDNQTVVCCRRDGDDLVCRGRDVRHGEARSVSFYARSHLAYHLFDSFQKADFLQHGHIEWSNLTVAPLYRRALGLSEE